MPEDRSKELNTNIPPEEEPEYEGPEEAYPEPEEAESILSEADDDDKEYQNGEFLLHEGAPKLHVRKSGTGEDDLPGLDRADEGLPVRLDHEGSQELDELLFDIEERDRSEKEDYGFESQIDEEAEEQKKEKFRLKDEKRKRREKEYYRKRELQREQEYFQQEQSGIEKRLEEESEYDRQIRSRYEYAGVTVDQEESAGAGYVDKDAGADAGYESYGIGRHRTGITGVPEIVEEADPQFFENTGIRVYEQTGYADALTHRQGAHPGIPAGGAAESGTPVANAAGFEKKEKKDPYDESLKEKYAGRLSEKKKAASSGFVGVSRKEETAVEEKKEQDGKRRTVKAPFGTRAQTPLREKARFKEDGLRVSDSGHGGWRLNETHTSFKGRKKKEEEREKKSAGPEAGTGHEAKPQGKTAGTPAYKRASGHTPGYTSPGSTAPGIAGASVSGILTGPGGYIRGVITGEAYKASKKALEEGRKHKDSQSDQPSEEFTIGAAGKIILAHGAAASYATGKRKISGPASATGEFYMEKKLRAKMIRLGRDGDAEEPENPMITPGGMRARSLEEKLTSKKSILDAKIRDGRMRGMDITMPGSSISLGRDSKRTLLSQSIRMNRQTNIALRFLSKKKQAGQAGAAFTQQSATAGILTDKIKRILVAAAKKAVVGITATAVGAGALLSGGIYNRYDGGSFTSYYYPVQAHMPAADGEKTTMTQEVMTGMTERMKAYGIPLSQDGSLVSGNGTIRIHIPGYTNVTGTANRWGDCQIITDGSGNCLIIDGGCGRLSDSMIEYLNAQGITRVSIMISHWDSDHTWGFIQMLRETTIHVDRVYCFSPSEVMGRTPSEAMAGQEIINKVSASGGDIVYIPADKLTQLNCGSIRMIAWRKGNPTKGSFSTQANDMSIQVYFPDLYYYTTGDMIYYMPEFLDQIKTSTIKCVKTPHHGNGARLDVLQLKNYGTEIAWDNNVSGCSNPFEVGTRACVAAGFQVIETNGDIEMTAGGGVMTITGDGKSFTYRIPYTGGGSNGAAGGIIQQVVEYAKSWAGKIPYGSAWNGTDPNEERWLPLKEGRPSDCSWFVFRCFEHFGIIQLAPDESDKMEKFIHSYEWGNKTEKYGQYGFKNVGTDMSQAIPGDVICTGAGTASDNSHVAIYIGDGKVAECGAGVGTTISNAPKNPRQIVRYMGASTTAVMGAVSTDNNASDTRYGFTPQTEKIVESHINDFSYDTYDDFMASRGGALAYVRSLNGVFAKWAGRDAHVQTAGEFQEIAEYVMGLYTIWGVDYHGGKGITYKFNEENGEEGRFYKGMEVTRGFSVNPIEEVLFNNKEHAVTDCGCGIYHIMQKAGLLNTYAGMSNEDEVMSHIDAANGGKIIHNYNELQVGDLLQMIKPEGWRHVAVVGEKRADGTIIAYDTGNRYVRTANYKKNFTVDSSNAPAGDYDAGYIRWFGVRIREISQTGSMSASLSNTATQNLKKIKVNSVKIDGNTVDKGGITMENFKSYSRGDIQTTNANVSWQFTDMNGNVIGSSTGFGGNVPGIGGAAAGGVVAKILQIAESHLGTPYVYGGKNWDTGVDCSYFVTAVLQEAGVYHGPYKTSYQWAEYGREVPDISMAQAGDIIISNGGAHVSLYDGVKYVYEAKGGAWGCVHDRLPGNIVTIRRILPDMQSGTGVVQTASGGSSDSGTSAYNQTPSGSGQSIDIPDGLGDIYLYMGWQCITSPSSNQYRLREQAGQKFDEEGFGIINGRYVIACAATFGKVGDYVDFYKTDGNIFHCIIGEMKSEHDNDYNKWGHRYGHNIIEFCVDKDTWYPSHANPGTPSCHPEWKGNICRAVNLGSYFNDPTALMLKTTGSMPGTAGENGIDEAAMFLKKQILSMSALGSYYDDPADMEKYGEYCYDILDYAVCRSHGADLEYTTVTMETGSYMTCEAKITIVCSQPLMEKNDKNYTSWGTRYEQGDLMPAHYMSLSKDAFEDIFNVDTTVRLSGRAEGGDPQFDTEEEKAVYRALKSLGYGPVQIAGMMANIYFESHFRPDADNGSGAYGLFQWMGNRFSNLKKLAALRNAEWTDIQVQCEYAYEETHGGSGWNGNTAQKDKFESTIDPYEAGALFSRYWERHGTNADGIRGSKAKEYYQIIMSAGSGSATGYVQFAIDVANNDGIGYCQPHRNGPEYDCSSLVFYSLLNAGYDVGNDGAAFTTYGMDGPMARAGFEKIHISSYDELVPGDVLWKPTHTELYVGNGKSVGAHGNEKGRGHAAEEAQHGDQTGGEISVVSLGSWEWVYRKR